MDKHNNSSTENTGLAETGEGFDTVFDDVFRTIAQKMPFLLIPLINEVFGTAYAENQKFLQLRNEHYEKFGIEVCRIIMPPGSVLQMGRRSPIRFR